MHVIFVEPSFPRNQGQFVRSLLRTGARVSAISEKPPEMMDSDLISGLAGFESVPSVTNEGALEGAVRRIQAREWVDRLETTVEAHILPVAKVRATCNIPGTTERTAYLCRDKPAMKEALREAGVPCAESTGASSESEVRAFVSKVGYPVILKPRDAAGSAGTYRAGNDEELAQIIETTGVSAGAPTAVEEFVEGHEGFYDTICIEGRVVHDFVSHYYPNVLEAMRARWISPQIIATNRMSEAGYDEVKEMGQKVIETLGIWTSATHMEWFFGPKGLRFSEIGCRPPGVRFWDLYGVANDLDLYDEWAKAIVHGGTEKKASRRLAAGLISLRPQGDGTIAGYEGLSTIQERFGDSILDCHLPPAGSLTQPVEGGYMANAWIRMGHENYDELRRILDEVGQTIEVRVGN